MKLICLSVNSKPPAWVKAAIEEYSKKIGHFISFEVLEVESGGSARSDSDRQISDESKSLLKALKPDDWVTLCNETGKAMNSIEFSASINQILVSGKKRWVFIIGGAFGVSEEIKKRANSQLSLSKLVFNHHIARVVLLEQIYRGFSILKNLPYHNS